MYTIRLLTVPNLFSCHHGTVFFLRSIVSRLFLLSSLSVEYALRCGKPWPLTREAEEEMTKEKGQIAGATPRVLGLVARQAFAPVPKVSCATVCVDFNPACVARIDPPEDPSAAPRLRSLLGAAFARRGASLATTWAPVLAQLPAGPPSPPPTAAVKTAAGAAPRADGSGLPFSSALGPELAAVLQRRAWEVEPLEFERLSWALAAPFASAKAAGVDVEAEAARLPNPKPKRAVVVKPRGELMGTPSEGGASPPPLISPLERQLTSSITPSITSGAIGNGGGDDSITGSGGKFGSRGKKGQKARWTGKRRLAAKASKREAKIKKKEERMQRVPRGASSRTPAGASQLRKPSARPQAKPQRPSSGGGKFGDWSGWGAGGQRKGGKSGGSQGAGEKGGGGGTRAAPSGARASGNGRV